MPRRDEVGEPFSYNPSPPAQQPLPTPLPPSYWNRPPQKPKISPLPPNLWTRQPTQQQLQYVAFTRPSAYGARDYTTFIPIKQVSSTSYLPFEYAIAAKAFVETGKKTWTEKDFEKEFGVEITGLPSGALITGYSKKDIERMEQIPLGIGKTWKESEFESEFGVSVEPNLPSSAVIIGYSRTSEGFNIEYYENLDRKITETSYELSYVPPASVSFAKLGTVGRGGRWGTEFDAGLSPHIAPLLIRAKEEKWPRLSETLAAGSLERGFVSAGESALELVFPYPTPTPKHHELGYLIFEAPAAEKVGYIFGSLATGAVLGYALSGPIEWTGEQLAKVGAKVSARIPESVKDWARFGAPAKAWEKTSGFVKEYVPSFRGSSVDVWLAKHSGLYYKLTGGVAKGEIALGSFERYGIVELEAEDLAMKILGSAPRLGGVYIAKAPVGAGASFSRAILPHLIYRGGKMSVGYLRELSYTPLRETQLTPFVSQQQLTRLGVQPYIPKVTASLVQETGQSLVKPFIGAGLVGVAELAKPKRLGKLERKIVVTPKVVFSELTVPLMREAFRLQQLREPSIKQRERAKYALVPGVSLRPILIPGALTVAKQALVTPQKAVEFVTTVTFPPSPVLALPKGAGFGYWPRGGGEGKLGRSEALFGKWFKRSHRIKTPKEMLKTFGIKGGFRIPKQKKAKRRKR